MMSSTRNRTRAMLYFNAKIFTEIDEKSDPEYYRILDQSAIKLSKNTLSIVGFLVLFVMIYLGFPLYDTIADGKLHLVIPILFPFTNLESIYGIVVNILSQMVINVVSILGVFALEIGTCITKHAMISYVNTIGYEIDRLTNYINANEDRSSRIIDDKLRNISYDVQEFNRYKKNSLFYFHEKCKMKNFS